MYAEKKLVHQGKIKLMINDDEEKSPEVGAGGNLLSVLADNKIFLPSACGGGGTCGMCKCQVQEGGGDVLPTEKTHLTRKEIKEHWRIACQVKIKEDMKPKQVKLIFTCFLSYQRNLLKFKIIKDI